MSCLFTVVHFSLEGKKWLQERNKRALMSLNRSPEQPRNDVADQNKQDLHYRPFEVVSYLFYIIPYLQLI